MNYCNDCNKIVSKNSKRCRPCKNKFIHKDYFCIDCNKKISRLAKRCRKCANKMQQKEPNRCINCNKIISQKSIRCRPCKDRIRHEKRKIHRCIDCLKIIGKNSKRCIYCNAKYHSGTNHFNYIGGRTYTTCIDCGKKTKSRIAKRCITCYLLIHPKRRKNRCVDCNKQIYINSTRCASCHYIYARGENNPSWKGGWPHCIDCGKQISRGAKRCTICGIKELLKTLRRKKNKPEKYLEKLLTKIIPKEYKYTGNSKFWIEKFNPDFINCNGQKKIIELFGDYWHTRNKEIKDRDIERLKTYRKYGYKTLIVWEKDLKRYNIEKIILNFNKK